MTDFLKLCDEYDLFINALDKENFVNKETNLPYWSNFPITKDLLHPIFLHYEPNMKFLDLGCGCGQVLRFAESIGYEVFGVEFQKNYFKFLKNYNVIEADIRNLEHDFYKEFDFIYIYRPLKKDFFNYLEQVICNMKSGSLIYTPYDNISSDLLCQKGQVFLQQKL